MKNENSKEIINKDNLEIDCFLLLSNKKEEGEENNSQNRNIVIICGPNLTAFESFINSWNLESLYLSNNTDIFFWNYGGYGFS